MPLKFKSFQKLYNKNGPPESSPFSSKMLFNLTGAHNFGRFLPENVGERLIDEFGA
jgi:hypothetical protein